MKTFSRLSLFTIVCLGFALMLVGGAAEVHAASLTVTGDTGTDKVYQLNDTVSTTFIAADLAKNLVAGANLTITYGGLTGVAISGGGTTDIAGSVVSDG